MKSKFAEYFIKANNLSELDFSDWLLSPGMLFNATDRWWDTRKKRKTPHEGIDLGFYRNCQGKVTRFSNCTKIPALYDGFVVSIFTDFLGQSVFIRHGILNSGSGELFTIFGHTKPHAKIVPGKMLKEGEIVATIASVEHSKASPHLHLTMGFAQTEITNDLLDWNIICNSKAVDLVDPIEHIGPYSLVLPSALVQK